MRVCAERGCPNLTASTRCHKHAKQKRRAEDRRRPSAQQRGYDRKWQRTRKAFLKAHPICQWSEGCIAKAKDVHHLDGKGPTGPKGHDWSNLQALCHRHHSITTAHDQPGGFMQGGGYPR